MSDLEIEVKFYLPDKDAVKARILDLGAVSQGRHFENNICFDDADKRLMNGGSLLRLRQDSRAILTLKSAPKVRDTQFKVFRELEVEVGNFEDMKRILEALGFFPQLVYEKWRETFTFNNCDLCLDTMPYGDFLEIEGGRDEIRQIADVLGLKWEKRIVRGYLFIFAKLREKLALPFCDLNFDNFKPLKFDFSSYSPMFEAG
ncbi:MAG: hypothetical protein BWK80_51650 [Desulfobacteraceae bacterium IS3]|nr:MAG: hypothetical protein BWK80_51650 [Desulfobacteraceae bacterium IS3]HAO19067.1 class IV adenylate cyclase [Desulfobacteraceae bacterium]